jgi:maltose/moltooligosaccharide transporter
MPNSSALWMAPGLLWIHDASINITKEPIRAYVADKLVEEQRTLGLVMQSFFIGIGQTLANALPYIFTALGVVGVMASGIPLSVDYSFKIGAMVFLVAVVWTVVTTKEYPPDNLEEFLRRKRERKGILAGFEEIFSSVTEMPQTMKQLAVVQFFTWFALPCMWQFFGISVARHVFLAPDKESPFFAAGTEWGGLCFAVYNVRPFNERERIDYFQAYLADFWSQVSALHAEGVPAREAATRIDMRAHSEHYPTLRSVGVDIESVDRAYELLSELRQ